MELIDNITFWHWLILAGVLLVLEMTLPVTFFLWLAIAAILTAVITFIFSDLSVNFQILIFSAFCILSLLAWRRWRIGMGDKPDRPILNQRGQIYVGRTFTLEEPIINGTGKIRVDDTTWKISGPDLAANRNIKVCATNGVILIVEATD